MPRAIHGGLRWRPWSSGAVLRAERQILKVEWRSLQRTRVVCADPSAQRRAGWACEIKVTQRLDKKDAAALESARNRAATYAGRGFSPWSIGEIMSRFAYPAVAPAVLIQAFVPATSPACLRSTTSRLRSFSCSLLRQLRDAVAA